MALAGVRESEVESLAGIKEGCEDDVEFMRVERPARGGPNQVGREERHAGRSDCTCQSPLE